MTDDPRVEQLLEEILDSDCTPEEVCGACPELLPRVQARLGQIRAVEAQFDALFPTPGSCPTPPVSAEAGPPHFPGYEVRELLGRGGMGIVYRAWHRRLNRHVALKMLLAGAYARPEERERFLREAEAVAGLRHPNIVQVYDVGDLDGRPYFTMEFVEGGSLAQRLAGTPMPAGEAAALVATLAEAVQAAHDGGIVHRDLKPANVLLTADGTPKVTDFGLARRLDGGAGLTQSGAPLGTPSYMAPEQAQGKSDTVGPAADVYALGAILYEMLTGRPPFRAETAAETLRQVIDDEPVPPSRLNARVPRDLETICLKCLRKEPGALPERGGAGGGPPPVPAGRGDHGPGPGPGGAAGPVAAAPAVPGGGHRGRHVAGDRPGRRLASAVVGGACDRTGCGERPAGGGSLAAGGGLVRRGHRAERARGRLSRGGPADCAGASTRPAATSTRRVASTSW